jgi:acyl-CoA synthetase (AMP-forming)/AMP-acid ligase II
MAMTSTDLCGWPDGTLEYRSLHHLLRTQAERRADEPALAAPGRRPLSYSRLYLHVCEVVQTLRQNGLGRNDRVAIVLPNGPETAVAFLAVAAGATSAPLNPAYRETEFDFYLSDLGAKALIVQSGLGSAARASARTLGIPVFELMPLQEDDAGIFTLTGGQAPSPSPDEFAETEDVALVLHTSGTTAQPKIVPLTQANLCASAANIRTALRLVGTDRCLNIMPQFHIHSLTGAVLSSLAGGATVYSGACAAPRDPLERGIQP